MGWLAKLFHTHRGPVIKVEHIFVNRSQDFDVSLGWNTRVFCRCREDGVIFEGSSLPGKWTLDELRNE